MHSYICRSELTLFNLKIKEWTGEMPQGWSALAAFAEDLDWVTSTHMVAHDHQQLQF